MKHLIFFFIFVAMLFGFFFSTCLIQTSSTFTANAAIMGKVYFPRLVMPISSVITGMLDLVIQLGMLVVVMIGYALKGYNFNLGPTVLLAPIIIFQAGILGLGCGIIIAALTTKYRDLVVLVGFGVQLWMYATPVVYTTGLIPEKFMVFYMLNPMAPIMECWRNVLIGSEEINLKYWGISWITTLLVLFIGVILFNKVEKTFMDTV